jgi:hypothetical protein
VNYTALGSEDHVAHSDMGPIAQINVLLRLFYKNVMYNIKELKANGLQQNKGTK